MSDLLEIHKFVDGEKRKSFLEGVRAGLARAAKECDERRVLNESIEGPAAAENAAHHRAGECAEIAFAIRGIGPETVAPR